MADGSLTLSTAELLDKYINLTKQLYKSYQDQDGQPTVPLENCMHEARDRMLVVNVKHVSKPVEVDIQTLTQPETMNKYIAFQGSEDTINAIKALVENNIEHGE